MRVFECLGLDDYTRKDGTASKVLRWRGTCAVCGEEFTFVTGAARFRSAYLRARCKVCAFQDLPTPAQLRRQAKASAKREANVTQWREAQAAWEAERAAQRKETREAARAANRAAWEKRKSSVTAH